jgi:hypothetical protein
MLSVDVFGAYMQADVLTIRSADLVGLHQAIVY